MRQEPTVHGNGCANSGCTTLADLSFGKVCLIIPCSKTGLSSRTQNSSACSGLKALRNTSDARRQAAKLR